MDVGFNLASMKNDVWLGKNRRWKEIKRRIRKNGLSYKFSQNPSELDYFYKKMYLPYVENRFGDKVGGAAPFKKLRKWFRNGEILFITQDSQLIGGQIIKYRNGEARMCVLGVLDGNFSFVRMGAIGALYHYSLERMKERGYCYVNVGGTSPVLSDGVARFKISLGAEVIRKKTKYTIKLVLRKNSQTMRDFLAQNPFIFSKDGSGGPCRAIFTVPERIKTEKSLECLLDESECKGLLRTYIYVFDDEKLAGMDQDGVNKVSSFVMRPASQMFYSDLSRNTIVPTKKEEPRFTSYCVRKHPG